MNLENEVTEHDVKILVVRSNRLICKNSKLVAGNFSGRDLAHLPTNWPWFRHNSSIVDQLTNLEALWTHESKATSC